jgi:hypothetical protein
MNKGSLDHWVERVGLRSDSEPEGSGTRPRKGGGRGGGWRRGTAVGTRGARCVVSVSKTSRSSPGAASVRYHARDGVEVLPVEGKAGTFREDRDDRYSIVLSPENQRMDAIEMAMFADRVLERLEMLHGELRGSAWLHHANKSGGGRDHIHLAVNVRNQAGREIRLTQKGVERAVEMAQRTTDRTREQGMGR